MKLYPEILAHPHIPKPLHGLNPRTVLGKEWWDKTRMEAQERTDYRCAACGVHKSMAEGHKWLEGHEFWDINYQTGVCEVKSIEPLCHYCHNFIHSGRLSMIIGKEKSINEVIAILEHGFLTLSFTDLDAFYFTVDFAEDLGAFTWGVNGYKPVVNEDLKWRDYVMLLDGEVYKSKFKSQEDWINNYNK